MSDQNQFESIDELKKHGGRHICKRCHHPYNEHIPFELIEQVEGSQSSGLYCPGSDMFKRYAPVAPEETAAGIGQALTDEEAVLCTGNSNRCLFKFAVEDNDKGVGFKIIVTDSIGKKYVELRNYDSLPQYVVAEERDRLQVKFGFAQVIATRGLLNNLVQGRTVDLMAETLSNVRDEKELVKLISAATMGSSSV